MARYEFSIPFAVDIAKETSWNRADDHPYGYWIIRCHFMVRERQADDPAMYGRKLAIIETGDGVQPETVYSIKTQLTTIQVRESFIESMRQDESLQKFTFSLAASIGASANGKLSAESKKQAEFKIVESFKQTFKLQDTVTKQEEREYRLTYRIDPSVRTRLVAVAAYQRYVYDLYLTWIDYLSVRYTKSIFAIRKKRTKRPIVEGNKHINWNKFNVPLASVSIWVPLPHSAVLVPEAEYCNQIENEDEFRVGPPETTHRYFAGRPDCPTLYQVSNAAFPFKWIKRKTTWTEEELKMIEEGETDAIGWF
jgi:hypothetical protein